MNDFWLNILTNAGPMVLFVVWLLWRDRNRDEYQEKIVTELIKNNTAALETLATILDEIRTNDSKTTR